MFFNLGPFEIGVLIMVALLVFGPDRLPQLARDAARMLRTLRDMAQGARSQLSDQLGPEFGNLDIRSFNPRTALQKAIFDDPDEDADRPSSAGQRAAGDTGADIDDADGDDDAEPPRRAEQRPLARDEAAPFDEDTT